MQKSKLKSILNLIISSGILLYLFYKFSATISFDFFLNVGIYNISILAFLAITVYLLQCIRFIFISKRLGANLNKYQLYNIFVKSSFYGQIIPISLGPDIVRGYALHEKMVNKGHYILIPLTDKICGFCGLLVLLMASYISKWLYGIYFMADEMNFIMPLTISLLLLIVLTFLYFLYTKIFDLNKSNSLSCGALFYSLSLSLLVQLFVVLFYIFFIRISGYNINYIEGCISTTKVFITTAIPLGFSNWGIRELATVNIFQSIDPTIMLNCSISFGVLYVLSICFFYLKNFIINKE